MPDIELDRRSYLRLSKARFTARGSEPRRAFKRNGAVHRDLRELLSRTSEGEEGVRRYHRRLFLGYLLSAVTGILVGVAAGSLLVVEVLSAMEPKEKTPFLSKVQRLLQDLPEAPLALAALPLFLLAFLLDYLAYRAILKTIDSAVFAAEETS